MQTVAKRRRSSVATPACFRPRPHVRCSVTVGGRYQETSHEEQKCIRAVNVYSWRAQCYPGRARVPPAMQHRPRTLVVSGAEARMIGWRKHTQHGTTTEFAPLRVSSLEFGGAIKIESSLYYTAGCKVFFGLIPTMNRLGYRLEQPNVHADGLPQDPMYHPLMGYSRNPSVVRCVVCDCIQVGRRVGRGRAFLRTRRWSGPLSWEGGWSGANAPVVAPARWRATRREAPCAPTSSQVHLPGWGAGFE